MQGHSAVRADEESIQAPQRQALFEAIDSYLSWRNNKSSSGGRAYALKIFTRLRHFTKFGETRAINLRQSLLRSVEPLKILQDHFKSAPRVNNHSLDTFLLEAIAKNPHLFLVTDKVTALRTKDQRKALRKVILEQKIVVVSEYAYRVAKSYEEDKEVKDGLEKAFSYYTLAIRLNHVAAFKTFERWANDGNSEAQYVVGFEYYHRNGRFVEAINCCLRAAEQRHPKAMAYLSETKFSADNYLMIARKYDMGDGVVRNEPLAIVFYEKACALNNKYAAYRLGQLHQPNLGESKSLPAEPESKKTKEKTLKAFNYYFIAARQGDRPSLSAMELITSQIGDDKLKFKLAQAHFEGFANHSLGIKYFKELADNGDVEAINQLSILSKSEPKHACTIGRLYESEAKDTVQLVKACVYYIMGIQRDPNSPHSVLSRAQLRRIFDSDKLSAKDLTGIGQKYCSSSQGVIRNYEEARKWFEKAAERGCEVAHYELGVLYQFALGVARDYLKAARYYQLAYNKGHAVAKDNLDNLLASPEITAADLIAIASIYQNGADGVGRDWSRVAALYQRAAELGDEAAALYLGQFYQVEHPGVKKDTDLAFHFYLQAAKLGNYEALNPLDRLGEEVSSKQQLALSQIYASFFHKPAKSAYWHDKAKEVQEFKFTP